MRRIYNNNGVYTFAPDNYCLKRNVKNMSKIFRYAAGLLSAVMMMSVLAAVSFAAGVGFENAAAVKNGREYTAEIAEGDIADYIVTVSRAGKLKLNFRSYINQINIAVLDSGENSIEPTDYDNTSGASWWVDSKSAQSAKTSKKSKIYDKIDNKQGYATVFWDTAERAYIGTITFDVSKGIYNIRVENLVNGGETGKITFSPEFPSDEPTASGSSSSGSDNSIISSMAVSVPKGTSIQLGVAVRSAENLTVTWSSSNRSVASVTSKGKVTARARGYAVITVSVNGSKARLTIKVT